MQHTSMVNDTTSADSAEVLQQMTNSATRASETQQQLQTQLQQMQHAMGLLQSQVTTQGYNPALPNYNNQAPAPNYNSFHHNNQAPAPNYNSFNQRGGQNPFGGQHSSGYQGRGRGRGRGRDGRGNSPYRQRNTSIYCWSHGACDHSSANCNNKLAGHQDAVTFQNKMNGNTNQCPP
jgi:type II secretory pathway pseudopilin PulG